MKNKSAITIDELLTNESFLNYYYQTGSSSPDEADVWEWEDWSDGNPDRQHLIQQAFLILDRLSLKWSREQIQTKLKQLDDDIHQSLDLEEPLPELIYKRRPLALYWSMAASVLLFLGLGWWYYQLNYTQSPIYKELISNALTPLIEKENTLDKPLLVTLNDGSSILLQKGSRLSFPEQFATDKREVYLDGEAFFEVAKNPQQPFYVYANEVVAKVLGTSFTIKAYQGKKDIEVIVRTGKVSLYKLNDIKNTNTQKKIEGVVIVPNQQINFDKDHNNFSKSLVEQPQMLAQMPVFDFEFKDASAVTVFETIQKAYGISIVYDEEVLKDCPVTASLSDEPLYGKLDLICDAIEADYQILDGQIVISSKGCKN